MNQDVIISCAITGAGDTVGKHPAIPVTPEQIAASAIEAAKARLEKIASELKSKYGITCITEVKFGRIYKMILEDDQKTY